RDTFRQMHSDVRIVRADDHLEQVLDALEERLEGPDLDVLDVLEDWHHDATADSAGAAIWEVFWMRWTQAVAAVRFSADSADFIANWMNGFASRMLVADPVGWFDSDEDRRAALL